MAVQELLFGTFNANKAREVSELLGSAFLIRSCKDIEGLAEVEETGTTLEANALLKARSYFQQTGIPCFADDTGLEIYALDGAPGVYSARYAGPDCSADDNIRKVLRELADQSQRTARFRTVIAYVDDQEREHLFEGCLEGLILHERKGTEGFGYDPIFQPTGLEVTLAELSLREKNQISHRGRAFRKFNDWICNTIRPTL